MTITTPVSGQRETGEKLNKLDITAEYCQNTAIQPSQSLYFYQLQMTLGFMQVTSDHSVMLHPSFAHTVTLTYSPLKRP